MFYYIFKVKTSRPDLVPDHYIVNNRYIGYVGFDSYHIRSILEYNKNIKYQYQVFSSGEVAEDSELHKLFSSSVRFDENEATRLTDQYNLKKSKDKIWYEVYYPNKNSSKSHLREVGAKHMRTIKDI